MNACVYWIAYVKRLNPVLIGEPVLTKTHTGEFCEKIVYEERNGKYVIFRKRIHRKTNLLGIAVRNCTLCCDSMLWHTNMGLHSCHNVTTVCYIPPRKKQSYNIIYHVKHKNQLVFLTIFTIEFRMLLCETAMHHLKLSKSPNLMRLRNDYHNRSKIKAWMVSPRSLRTRKIAL